MPAISLENVSINGLGLMSMTTRPGSPLPKGIAFATMNKAIDTNLPKQTFFNGGVFYGAEYSNLVYLKEFFEKYPEQRKNVIVCIKGCIELPHFAIQANRAGITKDIDLILKYIPDLDIFEPSRLDPDTPDYTDVVATLDEAVDAGKIKGYMFSELSGATLTKVTKLAKHKPLGVEMEYSMISREILTETGLIAAAGELGIPVIAYSPISRGLLTGTILSKEDLDPTDLRNMFDRFSAENMDHNKQFFLAVSAFAQKKGVTAAQLALSWVKYQSGKTIDGVKFPTLIPIPSCSSVARVEENFGGAELTEEEFQALQSLIDTHTVKGARYPAMLLKYLNV